jgi:hypothetical protein
MKTIKLIAMALVACMALCFTSCSINDPGDSGSYTATCNETVNSNKGSGIIFNAIRDAVIVAGRGRDFRTAANDKVVIEAADKVAAQYKDQTDIPIVVSVVFRPGNAMGEAEKADIVIKNYSFTPVN